MKRLYSTKKIAALLMLMISWCNFQIAGLYLFIILQAVFFVVSWSKNSGRLYFSEYKIVNITFALLLITEISSFISDLPDSYKGYSLVMTIVLIPSYFSFTYIIRECKEGILDFRYLIKWFKAGILVQLIYLPVQFVLYKGGVDINRIIFHNLLHFMEEPTFFRQGEFFPSAFTWHSALLAPLLVIAFLIFEDLRIRALILLDTFICGNSTALIGVMITFGILAGLRFIDFIRHFSTNGKVKSIVSAGLIVLLGSIACAAGAGNAVISKFQLLIARITESGNDSSSAAHIGYYMVYPSVFNNNTVLERLFGTGYASSGYSISAINGQYATLEHWVTESDIIDILISRGIIGFVFYYILLGMIAFWGARIDKKYLIAVGVITIQGITYNVQFEYLFFIELIMLGSVFIGQNFFEPLYEYERRISLLLKK
ncbi:MAG: hypothetical protein IJL67_03055 [Oscillospiraceae bacterium]|nr:hypothetical protein [Oscillospiraceae bacterium]